MLLGDNGRTVYKALGQEQETGRLFTKIEKPNGISIDNEESSILA